MKLLGCTTALLAFALFGAIAAPAPARKPPAPLPRDSVYHLPVRLTDQSGKAFAWSARRGRPQLVAMFYTSCPYVCPLIVDAGKGIERQLTPAQRRQLDILYISIDPKRDTPTALRSVMTKHALDARRWTLARPEARDVRSLAGLLGVRYRALADGEFNHTSVLVLLDAKGRIVSRTETMGSRSDPTFVAAVRRTTSSPAVARKTAEH